MPNIFSFFDNGTWESFGAGTETVRESASFPPPGGATILCLFARDTAEAFTGSASGKAIFQNSKTNSAIYCPNFFVPLIRFASAPRQSTAIFAGMGGIEFVMKMKVKTLSSNPIGSPDLNFRIAPMVMQSTAPVTNVITPISITKKTVAEFTDDWAELEYRFIVQDNNAFYISLVADDSSLRVQDLNNGVAWDFEGSLNAGGEIFFDEITVEEIVACDLAYGSPQYTKTNETGVDLDNGSITVNANSSFLRQYRIDSGGGFGAWQNSNLFADLAPGSYNIEVQDMNGCTLPAINNIAILEFVPPACDVIISLVATTDETALDADDGTATVTATSADTLEYSINGIAYQASNEFEDIPPGDYIMRVRKVGGTCLTQQPFTINAYLAPPVAAPLVADMKPVNKHNFISWFSTIGKINFSSIDCDNCFWDLPNAYLLNKKPQRHYPVVTNDEEFSFYINFRQDFAHPDFDSFRLDLISKTGLVQQNVAPLERVFQADDTNYFPYASVTLNGVKPGIYRLAITNTNSAVPYDVLFISNEIQVMTVAEAPKYTGRFSYSLSSNMYRYLWSELPSDWLLQIRLKCNLVGEDNDGELTQYRAATTGKLRNVANDLDRFITLEMYYFDKLAHRAMEVFQTNDFILVNGETYLVKDLYKRSFDVQAHTYKGTLELFEQDFSTINRYGAPDAIFVDDPVLGSDDGNVIGV
jgi:hypothetical protein